MLCAQHSIKALAEVPLQFGLVYAVNPNAPLTYR